MSVIENSYGGQATNETRIDANKEWLSVGWPLGLRKLDMVTWAWGEFCREAARDHSPELQPWVGRIKARACLSAVVPGKWDEGGKVAPEGGAIDGLNALLPEHTPRSPLVRHIVLVLVVVLVLERVCWQLFRLELYLCAPSELHPAAGLEMLSGRISR